MNDSQFFEWLSGKYKEGTARSRLTNCRTVEQYEGNLDDHYRRDGGKLLIQRLSYTKNDERNNSPQKHNIPINGSIYNGTATLKQAVKLYFEFKSGAKTNEPKNRKRARTVTRTKKTDWPDWDHPDDNELYELIRLTAKYIKFLNPQIIEEIVKDNIKNQSAWSQKLENKNIDPKIYLWEKSPCAFPGVRRYAGSKEIAFFRKHTELSDKEINDAVRLDDNDFPKQIWSFIFRKNKFQKFGPKNYALAHLADHKEFNNRLFSEFEVKENKKSYKLFGLFTCPTNTAFIPTSLLRPTDFSPTIRRLLIARAHNLYGDFCNILPPWIKLNNEETVWKYSDFEWGDPVGEVGNVKLFLEFREETMNSILGN